MNFIPPAELAAVLAAFAPLFARPTWTRAQVLLCGVQLAPGSGIVTAALRVLGPGDEPRFEAFHRVINRARWSGQTVCRVLLDPLVAPSCTAGESLIFGLDESVERRRGLKITARAIYRDAARSRSVDRKSRKTPVKAGAPRVWEETGVPEPPGKVSGQFRLKEGVV